YPELLAQNVLSPVVRTETRVNGLSTGILVSSWQKFSLVSFTFTPHGGLPPDLYAEGWHISDRDTLSTSASMGFAPGSPGLEEWTAPIRPVTLLTHYAGKLRFNYEGGASIIGGQLLCELEVWLDGRKIWSSGAIGAHASGAPTLDLPAGHGPLDW